MASPKSWPTRPGHNGIQIDDNERLVRLLIEQHVVDLCIVVRNAQRKLAFFKEVGQAASLVLYGKQPIEFFAHLCHTIARVGSHVFLQLLIALARIVEIRDCVEKGVRIEICQHQLEIAERLTCTAHHVQVVAGIERHRRHVVAEPPEAVIIHQIVDAVLRVMEMQAFRIRAFFTDVLRDTVNVLHQLNRVLKRICIDALYKERLNLCHAGTVIANIIDFVGVVHVAHFDFFVREERAFNAEFFADLE